MHHILVGMAGTGDLLKMVEQSLLVVDVLHLSIVRRPRMIRFLERLQESPEAIV